MKSRIFSPIFFLIEIGCVITATAYFVMTAEASSSMTSDLLKLAFWVFLSSTIPVYALGAIHLVMVKRAVEFWPAFGLSVGGFTLLFFLGSFIPIFLPIAVIAPFVVFNTSAFWDYDF